MISRIVYLAIGIVVNNCIDAMRTSAWSHTRQKQLHETFYTNYARSSETQLAKSDQSRPRAKHGAAYHPPIEMIIGQDHVTHLIESILVPKMNTLFGTIRIADIPVAGGMVNLQALEIEEIALSGVRMMGNSPAASKRSGLVASVGLQSKIFLRVSLRLGGKGSSKVSASLNTDGEVHVVLWKNKRHEQMISVEWFRLKTLTKASLETEAADFGAMLRNRLLEMGIKMGADTVTRLARDGINTWGANCSKYLTFPLRALERIGIGPSGQCTGHISDETHVEHCRAFAKFYVSKLKFNPDLSVHVRLLFSPYVEKSLLKTRSQIPLYRGRPMPIPSSMHNPKENFEEALDMCIQDEGECNSIWATVGVSGEMEYRLGRTPTAIDEGPDLWKHCANEGGLCRFKDSSDAIGDHLTGTNMYDWAANGGKTDATRMMILRLGAFGAGKVDDYAETVVFDDGTGVPCRKDIFGIGFGEEKWKALQQSGALSCRRLTTHLAQVRATPTTGINCPLDRPCGLATRSADSISCFPEAFDRNGKRTCPVVGESSLRTMHSWKRHSHFKLHFTQPVYVAQRTRIQCAGPQHLACWADLFPAGDPPALTNEEVIRPSLVKFSISTDVFNSALATAYAAGIFARIPFKLDLIRDVESLCSVSKSVLCLSGVDRNAPIKFAVRQIAPSRFMTRTAALRTSLALELSVYVDKPNHAGVPLELMMRKPKECVRKEGVLRYCRVSPTDFDVCLPDGPNTPSWQSRWVELVGQELNLYTIYGRSKDRIVTFWMTNIVHDPKYPRCFRFAFKLEDPLRFCADDEATIFEWIDALNKQPKKCVETQHAAAAWFTFGVDLETALDVQGSYLCARPNASKTRITHIGKLHGPRISFTNLVLSSAGTQLVTMIVRDSMLLKPMQIWNLNALGYGMGLQNTRVDIGSNRILVSANARNVTVKNTSNHFSWSEDNACITESDPETFRENDIMLSPYGLGLGSGLGHLLAFG